MRIVALLVVATAGCTAPNPAFGDGTGGATSSESSAESEASKTTSDTTRGDATSTDATSSTQGDASDDDDDDDSDPIYDFGGDDGSTTESSSRRVWLFTAAVDNGAFGDPAGKDGSVAGVSECAGAYQNLAQDLCTSAPVALLRTTASPWDHPTLGNFHDAQVLSVDGYAIADTLTNFKNGNWVVEALSDAPGGGLEHTDQIPIATGGELDGAPNCGNWVDLDDAMMIADPDGEEGWFGVEEIACGNAARILCICPQ